MKNIKKFILISILFILFFIISATSYANTISNTLSDTFFRLHIIANSDSKEDQELKLKIRDEITEYMNALIKTEENLSKQDIINICKDNLTEFENIAKKIINDNGFSYSVKASISNSLFPTKEYGNISLPAGNYDALKIEIGTASGQNWWCSLFPPLCFIDISSGIISEEGEEYLKENLSSEEFSIVTEDSKEVKLKFKIIEFLNHKNIL